MLDWLKKPNRVGLFMFLVILGLVAVIVILLALPTEADMPENAGDQHKGISQAWGPYTDMVPMVDELPRTEMIVYPAPKIDIGRVMLIGRLARGIYKVRTLKGTIPFWFCGEPYEGKAAEDLAFVIAWNIVDAAASAETAERPINIWELAGLASNESGFDKCSLGLYPRQAAYRWKILKRRRLTVSHTLEDVERAIAHPRMRAWFPAFDLGMIMTLDVYYHAHKSGQGEKSESKDLFSWDGFRWQAEYFHSLMVRYNTKTPSLYWRGHKAQWKLDKVRRFARALGARPGEI